MKDFGQISFSKMAGGGNDFVMIDNRSGRIADASELTRRICTRRLSVGADGLILIERSDRATFRMIYLNSDGSRADFCANGTRCSARFAFLNAIAPERMTIETDAGIIGAEISGDVVTLALPSPRAFRPQRPVDVDGKTVRGSSILVGVPHYVIPVTDDLWSLDITPLGRAIRQHRELKPDGGANVNFVRVHGQHEIEVRTYERGVEAETLSCGSGVVASVSVSALFDRVQSPVTVLTRSGIRLEVSFTRDGDELRDLRLKGDARLVYRATITPDTLQGYDPEFVRDPASAGAKALAGG
ncbi:MAG: diaminopimelate epimerase [Thermoanaerobaculia bacterium]